MPELDAEHRNQLAEAASGHRFILDRHAYGEESCYCGWKRDGWDSPMHEDHLLDALAPLVAGWLADAQADALREAADELNTTDHATETALSGVDHAIDWLRDRAHSYRCGDGWNPTPPEGGYTAEDF